MYQGSSPRRRMLWELKGFSVTAWIEKVKGWMIGKKLEKEEWWN